MCFCRVLRSQEIGLGKHLRNDLFCVEWDVKPQPNQSTSPPCHVTVSAAGNSGMETLVENVDRSAVVLVFLSNRLKNSAACRSGTTLSTIFCGLMA